MIKLLEAPIADFKFTLVTVVRCASVNIRHQHHLLTSYNYLGQTQCVVFIKENKHNMTVSQVAKV